MEVVDDRLRSLKKQLKTSLSLESFQKYILLVESVINGRISKAESDMILSDLIPSELRPLHNQYIISVLEKVSDIESTIKAKQEPTIKTASLDPRIITLTKQERNALIDSLARLPIKAQEDLRPEVIAACTTIERSVGSQAKHSSLSSSINGRLPSQEILQERLMAIGQVYGLDDANQIESDCVKYLLDSLEFHLKRILEQSLTTIAEEPEISLRSLDPTPTLIDALTIAGVML